MELVSEWFLTGKFRKFDIPFLTDSTYEKELIAALPLTLNVLHKEEMGYHGKFGHTLERIQHIYSMSMVYSCYATCHLETQNVAPTLPGFQVIKWCVKYLASHPHKPIFYPYSSYDGSNVVRLTWSGNTF